MPHLRVLHAMTGHEVCEITVQAGMPMESIKLAIEMASGVPPREQRLMSGQTLLEDRDSLPEFVVQCPAPTLSLVRLEPSRAAYLEMVAKAVEHIAAGGRVTDLSWEARGDAEVMRCAAEHNPCELQFAQRSLLRDREAMLSIMRVAGQSRHYADAQLWGDKEFVLGAIEVDAGNLEFAPPCIREDREVVLAAVQKDGHMLKHADLAVKQNREVVLAAVLNKGTALCHASSGLKCDKELVMAAVERDPMAVVHADPELRRDEDVRRQSLESRERRRLERGF